MKTVSDRMQWLARSPFWAILPDRLTPLMMLMLHGPQGPFAEAYEWEASKPTTQGKGNNKMVVIPVQGVLSKDGPAWMGTNYDEITSAAEQAAADPSVKRVVLAVDSPGGEVTGLPETAATLAQLATIKPVSAIVEGISASAAYWLTSQAQDITLTPSGEVGSVGVRMMHVDMSKMLDAAGFAVTELYAGQYKTEWSPFKPLTEDAKADMQTRLDAVHADFISAVSAGRGNRASADAKQARFGEGRMFSAKDAVGLGMADKIQAPREFYKAVMPAQETESAVPEYGMRRARLDLERNRF